MWWWWAWKEGKICFLWSFIVFFVSSFSLPFSQVWVLWTRLCGGELPWNLNRQSPIRSHLLWRRSAERPRKLHESTAQNWRHSCNAYRGSGMCYTPSEWYRISTSWLLFEMLTHEEKQGEIALTHKTDDGTFTCIIEPQLLLDLSSHVRNTHSPV